MTVEWKIHGLYNADAQKVADEISAIGDVATPKQILEKAKDVSTELHKCFEWNDTKAAEKYRLQQARQIVCHLVISETVRDDKPPIRFFHRTTTDTSGYQTTQIIFRNKDAYQELLEKALREAESWKNRYRNISELESIFEEIDKISLK